MIRPETNPSVSSGRSDTLAIYGTKPKLPKVAAAHETLAMILPAFDNTEGITNTTGSYEQPAFKSLADSERALILVNLVYNKVKGTAVYALSGVLLQDPAPELGIAAASTTSQVLLQWGGSDILRTTVTPLSDEGYARLIATYLICANVNAAYHYFRQTWADQKGATVIPEEDPACLDTFSKFVKTMENYLIRSVQVPQSVAESLVLHGDIFCPTGKAGNGWTHYILSLEGAGQVSEKAKEILADLAHNTINSNAPELTYEPLLALMGQANTIAAHYSRFSAFGPMKSFDSSKRLTPGLLMKVRLPPGDDPTDFNVQVVTYHSMHMQSIIERGDYADPDPQVKFLRDLSQFQIGVSIVGDPASNTPENNYHVSRPSQLVDIQTRWAFSARWGTNLAEYTLISKHTIPGLKLTDTIYHKITTDYLETGVDPDDLETGLRIKVPEGYYIPGPDSLLFACAAEQLTVADKEELNTAHYVTKIPTNMIAQYGTPDFFIETLAPPVIKAQTLEQSKVLQNGYYQLAKNNLVVAATVANANLVSPLTGQPTTPNQVFLRKFLSAGIFGAVQKVAAGVTKALPVVGNVAGAIAAL